MSARNVSSAPRPRLSPLPISRWASWFVGLAALLLIAASLGSYLYHRRQLESIAAQHLRLAIVGPGELRAGIPTSFNLLATRVTGEPWPTSIAWSLSKLDGIHVDHKERTDEQGRLVMTVPAGMALPNHASATAQLDVSAGESNNSASATLPLSVRPPRYRTLLELDRDSYQPGEMVFYRSLTLSGYGLTDCGTLPLEFEIVDGKSAPLPESQWMGLTERGVGNGVFRLPPSLSSGTYMLVARGADVAPTEATVPIVVSARTGQSPLAAVGASAASAAEEKAAEGKSSAKKSAKVEFFPEGGTLAAGLENRVYFSFRDGRGQPLRIRGKLVDSKGEEVTKIETSADGRGTFRFVPDAAGSYSARITEPAGFDDSFPLPTVSPEQKVAVAAVHGVLAPDQPLELAVRAAKANIPLVVAASCNGLSLGQQMLVTSAEAAKGMPVVVPMNDRAAGVVCATVYGASQGPLKAIARRLVFRQPRRLAVRAVPPSKPSGDLVLSIENEKGQAVAAALSVKVVRGGEASATGRVCSPTSLLSSLLADSDVPDKTALEGLDCQSAAAMDLALGCQDLTATGKTKPAGEASSAPLVFDNLGSLRSDYETALSEYREQRTHVLNALIMLAFFGGLALALLVTMLAILRIVWGSQLWMPTLIALACCAVATAVSNDPSRMQPVDVAAVGFAPSTPAPPAIVDSPAASKDSQLRRLAEKLVKYSHDAPELQADRFPVQQYVELDASAAAAEPGAKPLAWYPLLLAGPDGRVTVPGIVASAAKGLRLIIEAQGDGRVESCELSIK